MGPRGARPSEVGDPTGTSERRPALGPWHRSRSRLGRQTGIMVARQVDQVLFGQRAQPAQTLPGLQFSQAVKWAVVGIALVERTNAGQFPKPSEQSPFLSSQSRQLLHNSAFGLCRLCRRLVSPGEDRAGAGGSAGSFHFANLPRGI
jgi:hypothetical protein